MKIVASSWYEHNVWFLIGEDEHGNHYQATMYPHPNTPMLEWQLIKEKVLGDSDEDRSQ